MIAMHLIMQERKRRNLHFKVVNQVHDAIMLMPPIDEIEQCKQLFEDTMGSIDIPIGPPFNVLRLGVDVQVMSRWGEELKEH